MVRSEKEPRQPAFGPSALATPANALSLARILVAPILMSLIISWGPSYRVLVLWILLGSTDWVDGFVARRQGTTRSGAFLDPLADKVLILGAFFALVADHRVFWLPVALICSREIAVSVYRMVVARRGVSVPATKFGKSKTLVQDIALTLCLAPFMNGHGHILGLLVWFAAAITLASGLDYFAKARRGVFRNQVDS